MKIVGITGPIQHGKSTLAGMLLEIEPTARSSESGEVIAEVANAMITQEQPPADPHNLAAISRWANTLSAALASVTNQRFEPAKLYVAREQLVTKSPMYDKLFTYIGNLSTGKLRPSDTITAETKDTFRPLLQWIGGYVTEKLARSIWYETLIDRATTAEAEGCKLYVIGGVRYHSDDIVLHQAGGVVLDIFNPNAPIVDSDDPTELARQQVVKDSAIINDGSLDSLRACARQIYRDLERDALQPKYRASDFSLAG